MPSKECDKTGPQRGIRPFKAQATIELTIAFIACIVLTLGIIKVFVWMNKSMVDRQVRFQATRTNPLGNNVDKFYNTDQNKLDLFK